MPKWWSARSLEDLPLLDFDQLSRQDIAVLFKHSPTCPVSWAAKRQVDAFAACHPEIPIHTILVRQQRELSRQVEEWTGIRHESPQIIVLKRGALISSATHEDVTADNIEEMLSARG